MRDILRIFLRAPGARPISVFICMLLAGVFDVMSAGMVLPIASAAGGITASSTSKLGTLVNSVFAAIGFVPSLGTMLPILAASMALKALLSFLAMSYVASAAADVSTRIRRGLLDALMQVRWSYFSDNHPGAIANAISHEANGATETYNNAALIVTEAFKIAAALLIAALVSGRFFFIAIIGALIVALPVLRLVRQSKRAGKKQWNRTVSLVTYVQDAFANMKALKSMQRQRPFQDLFDRNIGYLRESLVKTQVARYGLNYGQDALITTAICGGVYVAAVMFKIPLPELLVLGFVFNTFIVSVKRLMIALQAFQESLPAYDHCMKMIADAEALMEPDPGQREPTLERGIAIENLTFAYGPNEVLHDVSVDIPAHGITVLIGPSGAGKTTLVDLVIGLHKPQEGRILVDGVPFEEISLSAWRGMIGYVPQELMLLHGSVRENIVLGDETITDDDIREALDQAGILEFIDQLPGGLACDVGQMGMKLSGGQRQRISLARALVRKPKLLILDEVTSALDHETELRICQNITGLSGRYTIIAITHRPAWLSIADRVYRVDTGNVVHDHSHKPAPALAAAV
jgi:ATP-binding cassette subfamily C protein